jgi:hypothetical protein
VDNIDMVELQRRHRLLAAAYRADRKRIEQLQACMVCAWCVHGVCMVCA